MFYSCLSDETISMPQMWGSLDFSDKIPAIFGSSCRGYFLRHVSRKALLRCGSAFRDPFEGFSFPYEQVSLCDKQSSCGWLVIRTLTSMFMFPPWSFPLQSYTLWTYNHWKLWQWCKWQRMWEIKQTLKTKLKIKETCINYHGVNTKKGSVLQSELSNNKRFTKI